MGHFPAAEHDRDLDLVTFAEELLNLLRLRRVVVNVDFRSVLHFLDDDVGRLLTRFLASLLLLVLVAPEVHDLADRRLGVRSNLDQIQLRLARKRQGLREGSHAELLAVFGDQQDLASPNTVVDPCFFFSSDVGITSSIRDPSAGRRRLGLGGKLHRAAKTESKRTTRTRNPRPNCWLRSGRVGIATWTVPLPN